jgi:acylphosphatase
MEKLAYHYLISGRVQGVYYRASTVKQAKALDITGWVRNLPDGKVEVFACGNAAQLERLQEWLWQGPPAAKVEQVDAKVVPWQELADFAVK